jgi:hypothetical protein
MVRIPTTCLGRRPCQASTARRPFAVKERLKTHNPRTDRRTKRDARPGDFMDQKAGGKPFEAVTKEK